MDNNTGTAGVVAGKLEPIAGAADKALRGGLIATPKGLAMALRQTKEEATGEAHRMALVFSMLKGADEKQIDAMLRGVVDADGEKYQLPDADGAMVKVAPAVFEMVKLGMQLQVARNRLAEVRAIRDAFRAGNGFDPKQAKRGGWFATVALARKHIKAKQEADRRNGRMLAERAALLEATEKLDIPMADPANPDKPYIPTGEEMARIRAKAQELIGDATDERQVKDHAKKVERARDRLVKTLGWDMAHEVAKAVAKMPKPEAPKAEPDGEVAADVKEAVAAAGGRRARRAARGAEVH